jgi:predicted phosphodiesterase
MIIFVTSDIHGRMDVVEKIKGFLSGREYIDCVILCGDITGDYIYRYFHELEEMQVDNYKEMIEKLRPLNRKILFIQGNHDVFCVDKDDECYLRANTDKDFSNMVPLEYLNFLMHGTKREGKGGCKLRK